MVPIIYAFSKPDKPVEPSELNFEFDKNPNPKLIKYGFNKISEDIDLVGLMSNSHYKVGLNFDFDRNDEQSFITKMGNLGAIHFDKNFAEFWEILMLFNLLDKNQIINTNHKETLNDIIDFYKNLTNSKKKWSFIDVNDKKSVATLIVYKYSEMDIDENVAIQFIIDDLPKILSIQKKDSTMILQFFGTQTQMSAELIYYLASYYNEAYLVKPMVTSELSDSKYLVLIGLNNIIKFPIPKHSKNVYLHSIGLKNLPNNMTTIIQCFNSKMMPRRYKKYYQIKSYLDTKVYEGADYQNFIKIQNENVDKWISMFTNLADIRKLTDNAVENSSNICSAFNKLASILA